jgi:3'(2'), 5'-bisphosphate nucleotidase
MDQLGGLTDTYQREIEVASQLAVEAAGAVMRYFPGNPHRQPLDVQSKGDDGPVTAADRAASDLIVGGLQRFFPQDALLSEEAADQDDVPARLGARRVWMIDPIDGTRDFIAGRAGFAVMIGLLEQGRPRLGVVVQPSAARLYVGLVGQGAWTIDGAGKPRAIQVDSSQAAIRLVASRSHRSPIMDRIKEVLEVTDEVNIGSVGLKLALIASGLRDLYINTSGKSKLWDACAPEAILAAAGGRVTDLFGAAIDYQRADLALPSGLVASSGAIHEQVVERIGPLFAAGTTNP